MDGHNDLLWEARERVGYDFDRLDIEAGGTPTHTDLPRLRQGGVGGQFWSVFVPASLAGDDAVSATLEQIDAGHQMVARYADQLAFARTADDVEAAWESGRIASLLGAEGGHSINNSLATLRMLHVLGVRYMTLTHNSNVDWADSATDVPVHDGLSAFGVEVVREMNRIGMLVDLSHVSPTPCGTPCASPRCRRSSATPRRGRSATARATRPTTSWSRSRQQRRLHGHVRPDLRQPRGRGLATGAANDRAAEQGITPADAAYRGSTTHRPQHPTPRPRWPTWCGTSSTCARWPGSTTSGSGATTTASATLPEGLEDVTGYPRLLAALADNGWSDDDLGKLTSGNICGSCAMPRPVPRRCRSERGPSLATITELDGSRPQVAAARPSCASA